MYCLWDFTGGVFVAREISAYSAASGHWLAMKLLATEARFHTFTSSMTIIVQWSWRDWQMPIPMRWHSLAVKSFYVAGVDVEWPLMKVIITFSSLLDCSSFLTKYIRPSGLLCWGSDGLEFITWQSSGPITLRSPTTASPFNSALAPKG